MPRSRVALLSWIVAVAFILGDRPAASSTGSTSYATPPDLPETANLVERVLGSADYRQAIWPVFLWTNLLFAIGFVACRGLRRRGRVRGRRAGGLPTFVALVTIGGIIAAIASIIPIGAVNAGVWLAVLRLRLQGDRDRQPGVGADGRARHRVTGSTGSRASSLAVGLVALVREARAMLSPTLRTWTWLVVDRARRHAASSGSPRSPATRRSRSLLVDARHRRGARPGLGGLAGAGRSTRPERGRTRLA